MIALDANTALRSFRDCTYDLSALAQGLISLASGAPATYRFMYADGTVQPMITATLLHALVASFPQLVVGDAVGIVPEGEGAAIKCMTAQYRQLYFAAHHVLPSVSPALASAAMAALRQLDSTVGLQARIDTDVLEYDGTGALPIEKGRIKRLVVTGHTVAENAGAALEGKTIVGITTQRANIAQGTMRDVTTTRIISGNADGDSIGRLAVGGLQYPAGMFPGGMSYVDTLARSCINELPGHCGGTAAQPAWYAVAGRDPGIAEVVEIDGAAVKIVFGALPLGASGNAQFAYEIPYSDGTGVTYYPVNSIAYTLSNERRTYDAPVGMSDFVIWPAWAAYSEGNAQSYRTYWQARVLTDAGSPFPVIIVRNVTDAPITGVANVWSFSTYVSDGHSRGSVSVLNRIAIPPRCSIEFLFSYDSKGNTACMSPVRAL